MVGGALVTRGPRRGIVAFYPCVLGEKSAQHVELECSHTVVRRRVLARQRVTNCEHCRDAHDALDRAISKAVARGTRAP